MSGQPCTGNSTPRPGQITIFAPNEPTRICHDMICPTCGLFGPDKRLIAFWWEPGFKPSTSCSCSVRVISWCCQCEKVISRRTVVGLFPFMWWFPQLDSIWRKGYWKCLVSVGAWDHAPTACAAQSKNVGVHQGSFDNNKFNPGFSCVDAPTSVSKTFHRDALEKRIMCT